MQLPDPAMVFPSATRVGIVRFWAVYWVWFLALLPVLLARQLLVSLTSLVAALWTWNRRYDLLGGDLRLRFLARGRTLIASLFFGERFLAVHHRDVLIDPGPRFARRVLQRHLDETGTEAVRLVAVTHFHEEHIGNLAWVIAHTGAPFVASKHTLARVAEPLALSLVRRWMIGQPEVITTMGLLADGEVFTQRTRLQVIDAPGHCAGHVAYYDPDQRILFAGDAYLHDYFSSPNADVRSDEWIATIERFLALDIAVLVGCHG
ncbi:MAG TPA: MBL fold metallo-hydrolase, partial [Planctomycetota bacterium]|nr:MBL fold metallo-hydrolase [Planctomycetota bacterium]